MTCLDAQESKRPLVVGEESAKVVEIDADRFAANLVAVELEHGPAIATAATIEQLNRISRQLYFFLCILLWGLG